jgi:hypothetical protein
MGSVERLIHRVIANRITNIIRDQFEGENFRVFWKFYTCIEVSDPDPFV